MSKSPATHIERLTDDLFIPCSRISHLSPSPTLQLRLSALSFYLQNDLPAARQHLKSCLNSDPDNTQCARAHRKLKNYEKIFKKLDNFKESGEWRAVLSVLKGAKVGGKSVREELEEYIKEELMKVPEQQGNEGSSTTAEEPVISPILSDAVSRSQLLLSLTKDSCKAYVHLDEISRAKPFCDAVLQRDPEDADALVARGEQAMKEERYEDAVRDFSAAFQKSGNQDRGIHARLTKAQKRQKLANTKDYYKVLGVSRDADERTIKKAYRTLARKHHPDKGGSQEKMAQINEAFGVLGDEELRKKYDMGDDPNDPMAQAGQGGYGNPFMFQGGMGGHPFAQFVSAGRFRLALDSQLTLHPFIAVPTRRRWRSPIQAAGRPAIPLPIQLDLSLFSLPIIVFYLKALHISCQENEKS